jgi:thiol-disulfide isomerase/thioredoxin
MTKTTISILAGIAITVIIGGTYFLTVTNSKGTHDIKYIEPEGDYSSFSDIVRHPDLKGKVVYVDYWHTGCSPCLEQFGHLPKLKETFKTEKGLAFLYLGKDRSVPGEKFRWKKMIEKKNLTGNHYFMSNDLFETLWRESVNDTSIRKGFPHYLIVDRNGRVINNNAPRPDDATLVAELTNALKLN